MQTRTRSKWLSALLVGLLILWMLVGGVLATGGMELPRLVLSGSGGVASGGGLLLSASLGQPVAGTVEMGPLRHCTGFWCGAAAPPPLPSVVYLPLTVR
jgi:hypothetical protein